MIRPLIRPLVRALVSPLVAAEQRILALERLSFNSLLMADHLKTYQEVINQQPQQLLSICAGVILNQFSQVMLSFQSIEYLANNQKVLIWPSLN